MLVVWEFFGKNIFIMILNDFPKEIESYSLSVLMDT